MSSLYVCLFSNGHLKVGRSVNALARISQHEERVSCLGVELVDYRVFDCVVHPGSAEAALIERCVEACSKRNKNEWFEGVDFDAACEWAAECAITPRASSVMRLAEYLSSDGAVTVKELAARIGVRSEAQVRQWQHGYADRQPSPQYCVAIEQATDGAVTRQDLRPSDWHKIWPELAQPTEAA